MPNPSRKSNAPEADSCRRACVDAGVERSADCTGVDESFTRNEASDGEDPQAYGRGQPPSEAVRHIATAPRRTERGHGRERRGGRTSTLHPEGWGFGGWFQRVLTLFIPHFTALEAGFNDFYRYLYPISPLWRLCSTRFTAIFTPFHRFGGYVSCGRGSGGYDRVCDS